MFIYWTLFPNICSTNLMLPFQKHHKISITLLVIHVTELGHITKVSQVIELSPPQSQSSWIHWTWAMARCVKLNVRSTFLILLVTCIIWLLCMITIPLQSHPADNHSSPGYPTNSSLLLENVTDNASVAGQATEIFTTGKPEIALCPVNPIVNGNSLIKARGLLVVYLRFIFYVYLLYVCFLYIYLLYVCLCGHIELCFVE